MATRRVAKPALKLPSVCSPLLYWSGWLGYPERHRHCEEPCVSLQPVLGCEFMEVLQSSRNGKSAKLEVITECPADRRNFALEVSESGALAAVAGQLVVIVSGQTHGKVFGEEF